MTSVNMELRIQNQVDDECCYEAVRSLKWNSRMQYAYCQSKGFSTSLSIGGVLRSNAVAEWSFSRINARSKTAGDEMGNESRQ